MFKERAEAQLKEMGYDSKQKALFYLGIIARAIDKFEKQKGLKNFGNKIYIQSDFEPDIQKFYNEAMQKVTEYDMEDEISWTIQSFVGNYTPDIENMSRQDKQ